MKKTLLLVLALFTLVTAQTKNVYLAVDSSNIVQGVISVTTDSTFPGLKFYKFNGDLNQAYIGTRTFDGINLVEYTAPKTILTKFEFNKRFTIEELVTIEEAAKTDMLVKVLMNQFNIAEEIDLKDQAVTDGLQVLVDKGLITTVRKSEILKGGNK